jgi:outer membrane receptor protein involved in Fe transport
MRFKIMLFIFSVLAINGFSQTNNSLKEISITGEVFEKVSQEPLMGASITLHNANDSTLLIGTVTDSLGQFKLKLKPKGKYYLEINFIGFVPFRVSISLLTENKDLGIIYLKPSEILLKGVTISGEKSLFETHLDKKVYNVEKDIMAESSSASEIMQNIPSVSVDINGAISLRNTSNVTIFINGKPSAMLRRNAAAILEQIPASSIERIEVITNPSAKYRPDGVGGIINIVLKKDAKKGLNAQITVNAGTENRYNGNVNLNYGTEKLNLFGNYSVRHSAGTFLFTDERLFKDTESEIIKSKYFETGNSNIDALSHTIFAGINYEINDYNNFELSGTYFLQNSLHKGFAEISAIDSMSNPDYSFINNQTNDEFEGEGEVNFAYEHIFKNNEDHTLTFEAAISSFNEKEDLAFNQTYSLPSSFTDLNTILIQKSGNQKELILDYALPIGEDAEFEGGYAGEFVFEDIRYDKNAVASRFLFNQEIHSLYALYGQSIEDFSFKAGIRAEQTFITPHLKQPTDSLINNNYFKLFPTIHLGYELSDKNQISLSYTKRINRPDGDELNPNPEFSDPRNAEAGNPGLKPEQIHSIEFGYQTAKDKYTLSSTFYYRYKYDAFTSIQTNINDTIVLTTIENLSSRQSAGIEATLTTKISKNWNFNLTGDVFYTSIDATNLGYSKNKTSVSGRLKAYSLIKLWKNTSIQINGFYYFPSITPQGNRKQFFYLNGGIKQQLFKNRASLTLTASDIFHTYKIDYTIQSNELNQVSSIQRKMPVVYLGFIWRFNNYKEKEKLEFEDGGLRK